MPIPFFKNVYCVMHCKHKSHGTSELIKMAASTENENKAIRHRKHDADPKDENKQNEHAEQKSEDYGEEQKGGRAKRGTVEIEPNTYWLTRIVFLRSLSFIYCKLNLRGDYCMNFAHRP